MPNPLPQVSGAVRPPRQSRSRDTLERILRGTETLLRDRLFEEITLADILRRSRVSVGAFYARFPGKEALIPCLYERYDAQVSEGAEATLDPARWGGRDLGRRATLLFRYAVMLYRRNRGLMRALALRARTHPEMVTSIQHENRSRLYDAAARILLECRREMSHPDPERAVRFGLLMAGALLREKILYDAAPHPASVPLSDRELATEITRAFLSYTGRTRS